MEERQCRKQLRLNGYDYAQPGAYFVTVCTKNRERILGTVGADDHIGPYVKLSEVGQVVDRYTRTVPGMDRYVIMPDHVHMILRISAPNVLEGPVWSSAPVEAQVGKTIKTWKTLITKELQCSVWQRSYYDHIIRCEQDYCETVRYIEENPAKWYYNHKN